MEEYVLEHFKQAGGWAGLHSEVRIWRTLFTYLLLDELFGPLDEHASGSEAAPSPVFRHPYQDRPLDLLLVDTFYARRAAALEGKLAVRPPSSASGGAFPTRLTVCVLGLAGRADGPRQRLEAGEGVAILEAAWARVHAGGRRACYGLEHAVNHLPTLAAVVEACPGQGLACVLRLMARHYTVTD